ncbi:MAG: metal ABC transporter permease [Planctomycetes bacterium]|nr:metal ABC transporter permease [Planctomycetota bacterium]
MNGIGEFVRAVAAFELLRRALLTAVLASVACGVVGTYVVTRRITYLAGGIAHCVLGGLGAAVYVREVYGIAWLDPLYGAVAAALLAAVVIGVVSLRFRQRVDTVISAMWAVGMASGLLFLCKTPGYQQDLMSYLFGSISIVSASDVRLLAALDVLVVGLSLVFYRQFLAVCFDEEFARTRGLNVEFYYLLLLCMTALTVVLLVTVVGIILVIALLTLPVAVAGLFARRLWQMMLLAVGLSVLVTTAGLAVSYSPGLPAGATTIILAGGLYLAVLAGRGIYIRGRGRPG